MSTVDIGNKGEAIAAAYYIKQGYSLYCHGYRCRMGELDLVMIRDLEMVIVEVKYRNNKHFMQPREAVDHRKQAKIILAAQKLIGEMYNPDALNIRFDVVEVMPNSDGNGWTVHCIKDAFQMK